VHAECGDPARARAIHEEQLEIARRLGAAIWIADALGNLGDDLLLAGDLAAARSLLEEAVAAAGECGEKLAHPLLGLGELALRSGRPDDALAAVERFRAIGRDQRVIGTEADRIEAAAWSALGRHAEAAAALATVIQVSEAVGTRPTRWRAGVDRAEALRALGRSDEARTAVAEVHALLEAFAAELPEELAAGFRQSALVRRAATLSASAATT
jgi:tetratricopeptide (TPR) repeat protein